MRTNQRGVPSAALSRAGSTRQKSCCRPSTKVTGSCSPYLAPLDFGLVAHLANDLPGFVTQVATVLRVQEYARR